MPLIAIDVQHRNKAHDPWDRGAVFDLDGDGEIGRLDTEAEMATGYAACLRARLERRGIPSITGFSGTYRQRNRLADELGASLYIACHFNMGGGKYGLIGVDHRAPRGGTSRMVAGVLAQEWRARLQLGIVRVEEASPSSPQRWRRNLFATIGHCICPAITAEPLFLDGHADKLSPEHRPHTLDAIAAGLEAAIVAAIDRGHIT